MTSFDTVAQLPGWVVDDHTSIMREAAPYRGMSPGERGKILRDLCRGAARQLSYRKNARELFDYQDPLPESTKIALARLRKK